MEETLNSGEPSLEKVWPPKIALQECTDISSRRSEMDPEQLLKNCRPQILSKGHWSWFYSKKKTEQKWYLRWNLCCPKRARTLVSQLPKTSWWSPELLGKYFVDKSELFARFASCNISDTTYTAFHKKYIIPTVMCDGLGLLYWVRT